MDASEVIRKLGLDDEAIVNVYPYGSRVYGTATENSDYDYIIVYKSALLPNGAFRNNAISSEDRKIQAVCYSRAGFQDALNNYEIGAIECMFLPEDKILRKQWPFKNYKWDKKEMSRKIITKASDSWHNAKMRLCDDDLETSKKGLWHALRILLFGIQLKEQGRIVDFTEANSLRTKIFDDEDFNMKKWFAYRDELMEKLRQ
jgi:hypothetical protein